MYRTSARLGLTGFSLVFRVKFNVEREMEGRGGGGKGVSSIFLWFGSGYRVGGATSSNS